MDIQLRRYNLLGHGRPGHIYVHMCAILIHLIMGHYRSQYGLIKISVADHRHYLRVFEVPKTHTAKADKCSELMR